MLPTARRPLLVLLALMALALGQSAGVLHALKHVGSGNDATDAPVQDVPLCLECASFAPLTGAHGGPVHATFIAVFSTVGALPLVDVSIAAGRGSSPFQARAPPR